MSLGTMFPLVQHVPDRQNALDGLLSERRRLIDERADAREPITRAMLTQRLDEINTAIIRLNGGSES